MGTSSSNPGPNNKSPLLPPWVDPDAPLQAAPAGRFGPFRTALGNWGKSGNQNSLKSALGSYTRKGYGGSRTAAQRLSSVPTTGAKLHSLLSEIASGGDGTQTLGESLGDLEGISVDRFIDIIVDAVCPELGTIDDELLRLGLDQALSNCLQEDEFFDPSNLTPDMLVQLYSEFISEEVSNRIIADSKNAFNRADNAVQRENELREFVKSTVDVCAGPRLEEGLDRIDSGSVEKIISEIITEVFQTYGAY
ncbi:hypothetical protein [Pseudodesulfovibrio sediminis]|uniref:Uncharacterized protein n=1 Tax=Pseudodesulfovibrio sediminis TaxID=2810563 RepID=A0ABM7P977_9BACT|nr:hypothetical protein [Pseudodesulfovibrio sediminis]BCS89550.1 hypothetical protein PSDVSF_27920 [Pseudodesulfovibrio sediminis]